MESDEKKLILDLLANHVWTAREGRDSGWYGLCLQREFLTLCRVIRRSVSVASHWLLHNSGNSDRHHLAEVLQTDIEITVTGLP